LVDGLLELGGREWDGDGSCSGVQYSWQSRADVTGGSSIVVEGTIWGVMACLDARRWMNGFRARTAGQEVGAVAWHTKLRYPHFDRRCIERSMKRRELNMMTKVQGKSRIYNEK
jgi:hypothetical protein